MTQQNWKIIICLVIFFSVAQLKQEKRSIPPAVQKWTCIKDYPFYSEGLTINSQEQFEELRKTKWILAELSSSECHACCKYELFYQNLQKKFLNKNKYLSEDLNVEFVRIDIQKHYWVLKDYTSDRVPFLVLYKPGQEEPFRYRQYMDYKRIMRFIENANKPLQTLQTAAEVEKFMSLEVKDLEKKKINVVKILGLFYDLEEMIEDITQFKLAAREMSSVGEIQFAICTVPAEVKKLQIAHEKEWFEPYSFSTVTIKKKDGYFSVIDLSLQTRTLSETIFSYGLRLFGEATSENYAIVFNNGLPTIVVLVDTVHEYQQFKDTCRLMEKVAAFFIDQVNFVWGDGIFNQARTEHLGIKHKKLPAIAFDFKQEDMKLVYPEYWEITSAKMKYWVEDYLDHKYDYGYLVEKYDYIYQRTKKSPIYNFLDGIEEVKNTTFQEKVIDSTKDCLVFYFHSRRHASDVKLIAHRLNHITKRLHELFILGIRIYFFDGFYSKLPLKIHVNHFDYIFDFYKNVQKQGALFFYQAGKKDMPKVYKDIEKMNAKLLMEFLIEHSTKSMNLPKDAHIPEDLLDEYYESRAEKLNFDEDRYLYKMDL